MKSYTEIQGWCDYEDLYSHFSDILKDDSVFVEIGVWKGRSICFLGQQILIKGKKTKLFGVDTFKGSENETPHQIEVQKLGGSTLPIFESNISALGLQDIVFPIESNSVAASSKFENGSIDIIFVDGDHSYEGVKADLAAWTPKMKSGGIMCGHDFWASTVKQAVFDHFTSIQKIPQGISSSCWAVKM